MKRFGAVLCAAALVAGLLCASSEKSVEASVVALSVEDLVNGSDCCVRATVLDAEALWSSDGQMLHTVYTLQLVECLMGSPAQVVQVRVPGGTKDGVTIRNSEAATFSLGEDVVVFADEGAGGQMTTTGWFQGKFTLLDGKVRELNDQSWQAFKTEIQNHVANK